MADSLGRAVLSLGIDDKELDRGIAGARGKVGALGKDLKSFGRQTSAVGRSMSIGFTLPVVALGGAALKMSTDFNEAMANVGTLIPGNIARVQELKTSVQDMAIATGKSTDDLAGGLYEVVSAFGDTAESAKILEINARAATAGLASTANAIDLTSAVTKGYGDTSADAVQRVSDLALLAVRLGQTNFPDLAASIGRVTPLTAELGVAQEDLFAVMATGTGVTGGAAEVSTQLRGIMQGLMAPTKDMNALFAELGVTSGKALIEQRGLKGAVDAIVGAAEESGTPLAKYLGSIEGQTLALALAGAQSDAFVEKQAAMRDSSGATDAAFREQTEGVNAAGHEMKIFRQELIVAGQRLGDSLAPALRNLLTAAKPIISWLVQAVTWFGNLSPNVQTVILGVVAFGAAIGPVLTVGGTLITVIGGILPVLATVGTAIAAISSGPLLLIVGAITAVVMAWQNWDVITGFARDVYTGVKTWLVDKFQAVVDSIKGKIDAVTGFFGDMYDRVVGHSFVPDMLDAIGVQFGRLGDVMVAPATQATLSVEGVFSSLSAGVATIVDDMLGNLGGKLDGFLKDKLGPFAGAAKDILGGLIDLIPGGKIAKGIIGFGKKLFGFSTGTRDLDFQRFSPMGQPVMVHNDESIIPRGGGHQLAGEIAAGLLPHLGGSGDGRERTIRVPLVVDGRTLAEIVMREWSSVLEVQGVPT